MSDFHILFTVPARGEPFKWPLRDGLHSHLSAILLDEDDLRMSRSSDPRYLAHTVASTLISRLDGLEGDMRVPGWLAATALELLHSFTPEGVRWSATRGDTAMDDRITIQARATEELDGFGVAGSTDLIPSAIRGELHVSIKTSAGFPLVQCATQRGALVAVHMGDQVHVSDCSTDLGCTLQMFAILAEAIRKKLDHEGIPQETVVKFNRVLERLI